MNEGYFSEYEENYSIDPYAKLKWFLATFQQDILNFVDDEKTQLFKIYPEGANGSSRTFTYGKNSVVIFTSLAAGEIKLFLTSLCSHKNFEILDFHHSFFQQDLSGVEKLIETEEEIFIRENGWLKKILVKNINWIKVEGVYTHLACQERLHTLRITAKNLFHKLPAGLFYQIHKSYYVNRTKIEAINSDSVKIGGNILPIGRTFHKSIMSDIVHAS